MSAQPSSSRFLTSSLALLGAATIAATAAELETPLRLYSHPLQPQEHPDYSRRAVRPPTWATFKNQTQFTCLRGFNVQNDQILGYKEELEKFTRTHQLGDVIWPSYPILFATNLNDLAVEIRDRDLYLFDIWGYVPGSGPGGYWQQFTPPPTAFTLLEQILGDRWLGTDIGEQDGRYVGGYAGQMTPASGSRLEQYLNFQRHFERMGDDLGHRHATLVSLNFGHYLLKEGTYTLIGAETAQALPNNQVYYSFIRGAGKQYGVPWFGNASIFNRWGFKTYGSSGKSDGYEHGPTKGTSLSLMKRLLYTHILYNSMAAGFENGWFDGDRLSPLGRIQQSAQKWVHEHPQPGTMQTPVAILVDFFSGWSFPRHLYTDNAYRVWGNLPYDEADYFTDALLDLLYPGYETASYYHDESGFLTPTPYGDIADCLLSDAPGWLLDRYSAVLVAGRLTPSRETAQKLRSYAEQGGHVVIAEANARALNLPPGSPAPGTSPLGRGKVTVFGPGYGVELLASPPAIPAAGQLIDQPLPKPYRLPVATKQILEKVLHSQALFQADPALTLVTCRKGPGLYTVGVANSHWRALPLKLISRCGDITETRELPLDTAEREAVGYLPESVVANAALGDNTPSTIAGGDIRIFEVKVNERSVEEIPHQPPPPAPRGRFLPLRQISNLKEAILARPTFFQHYDGVVLDWSYLRDREPDQLRQESRWLRRQSLRIAVDASSGINLYPGLRLINNLPADYEASLRTLETVVAKMQTLGATDLLVSLHRHPENNFTGEQAESSFVETLKTLSATAAKHDVTLHLRQTFAKPPWSLGEIIKLAERVGAPNLKIAPATSLLWRALTPEEATSLQDKLGFWLVAGRENDVSGKLWNAHAPLATPEEARRVAGWLTPFAETPVIFDSVFNDPDSEFSNSLLWTDSQKR